MEFSSYIDEGGALGGWQLSPLEGEMAAQRPEGVLAAGWGAKGGMSSTATATPPRSAARIEPRLKGEGSVAPFTITAESAGDILAREALLDRAMGPGRKRKSSEKLRRGRRPSEGLAFVARDHEARIVGTVRLWDVAVRSKSPSPQGEGYVPVLLLGPLAVDPRLKGSGIGSALMRHAIAEARRLGHRAILLVGDASYYGRFGFSAESTTSLAMPGPYERHRFLALELKEGALDGAAGVIKANGRKSLKRLEAGLKQAA